MTVNEIPPLLEADINSDWFNVALSSDEFSIVGEYDSWQGPARSVAMLKEDRSFSGWGIIRIPGKWRLVGDLLVVKIDTGEIFSSRMTGKGHFYGDIQLRRIRKLEPAISELSILNAEYGSGDTWIDVSSTIREMVSGNRLTVVANSGLAGKDPTPGQAKKLKIAYTLNKEAHYDEVDEGLYFRVQSDDVVRSRLTYKPVCSTSWLPNVRYRILSVYMDNTQLLATAQKRVFDALGYPVEQIKTYLPHGIAIDEYLINHRNEFDYLLLIDIDAIPLNKDSIPTMLANISSDDRIIGPLAHSNHINHDHPFAGAFGLCMPMKIWDEMGRPSMRNCHRSDTSEDITWAAEEDGFGIGLMWAGEVELPKWTMGKTGQKTGHGTTFLSSSGIPIMYHAFECRFGAKRFIDKCNEVIKNHRNLSLK